MKQQRQQIVWRRRNNNEDDKKSNSYDRKRVSSRRRFHSVFQFRTDDTYGSVFMYGCTVSEHNVLTYEFIRDVFSLNRSFSGHTPSNQFFFFTFCLFCYCFWYRIKKVYDDEWNFFFSKENINRFVIYRENNRIFFFTTSIVRECTHYLVSYNRIFLLYSSFSFGPNGTKQ